MRRLWNSHRRHSSAPVTRDHASRASLRLGDFALLDKVLLLDAGILHSPEISDKTRDVLLLHIAAIKKVSDNSPNC